MIRSHHLHVVLDLDNVDELFTPRQVDPFLTDFPSHGDVAGVDFIIGEILARPSYRTVAIDLTLPDVQPDEELSKDVATAITRWSRSKLFEVDQRIRGTRWRGVRTLFAAFVALFAFIGMSRLLATDDNLALQILSEGLSIAGWVALWFPLEVLMFDVWQHRLDRRAYERLMMADVSITSKTE